MPRIDVTLVVGGDFHDFDYARLRLLDLLHADEDHRVRVFEDYSRTDAIAASDVLVTYTCNVRPTEAQQQAVADWVAAGHRWVALHGTNSALDLPTGAPVRSPRAFPKWVEVLGTQFIAHPPIAPYRVEVADPDHPITRGIAAFDADDELYLCEHHGDLHPLLFTRWTGEARGFEESSWPDDDPRLVAYTRAYGDGEVLYLTLGHCRGPWDMQPRVERYPKLERGSWEVAEFNELLRRSLAWAAHKLG